MKMNGILQDLRHAFRQLRNNPGFTALAVITLAVGIGMNTAVFSVVDAAALRLPFQHQEQLVVVENGYSESDHTPTSFPDFMDWRDHERSFTQLVASFRTSFNLTGVDEPQRIRGRYISQDYFALFGTRPLLGRSFSSAEHVKGGPNVCLLSEDFWRRQFSADPGVLTHSVVLDGIAYSVVGVMPATSPDIAGPISTDLWIPLESRPPYDRRGTNYLQVIGRLKPGVARENAAGELQVIQDQINKQFPSNQHDVILLPLTDLLIGDVRPLLEILLVAVGLVLFIACANVANLMLARGAGRTREIAVREALGAARWRIVRQLLTESALLAAIALVASVFLAWCGTQVLLTVWPENQKLPSIALDWRVPIFAAGISVLAVLVFGLAPALLTSRSRLDTVMKEGGRGATDSAGHGRLRTAFVAAEIALALILVIGSVLTLRSFYRMLHTDPGFNKEGLLTARVALPESRYSPAAAKRFFATLLSRITNLPGVQSAGATAFVPLGEGGQTGDFRVEGRPAATGSQGPFAEEHFVTPSYFQTMQIALLRGRTFSETDKEDTPKVVLVNNYMARELWPGQDPVGKRIQVLGAAGDWSSIVGVVADVKTDALNTPPSMQIYLSTTQRPITDMYLVIRASTDAGALIPAVKSAVFNLDDQQPVANLAVMDQLLSRSVSPARSSSMLLAIFAGVALLLAVMGIYAVMAYSVGQRAHEIGIRMALGAGDADIQRMVMRTCAVICAWGLGVGLIAALLCTRLLRALLFGIGATDAATFIFSTVLLGLAAVLASYIPARRAARVDPMVALRYE
jgi:putative ABC transport system permease protein